MQWLKLRDQNTAYFCACLKQRQAQNHISRLINSDGVWIQTEDEVEEEITRFYRSILGTAANQLTGVSQEVMKYGSSPTRE